MHVISIKIHPVMYLSVAHTLYTHVLLITALWPPLCGTYTVHTCAVITALWPPLCGTYTVHTCAADHSHMGTNRCHTHIHMCNDVYATAQPFKGTGVKRQLKYTQNTLPPPLLVTPHHPTIPPSCISVGENLHVRAHAPDFGHSRVHLLIIVSISVACLHHSDDEVV